MHNMLFVLLVSFAVRTAESFKIADFRNRIIGLLNSIKRASIKSDEYDEEVSDTVFRLPWWQEYREFIQEKMPEEYEDLIDSLEDFVDIIDQNDIEDLLEDGETLRAEVILENRESLTYSIEDVQATYTIRWKDGLQVEYNCRPFMSDDSSFSMDQILGLLEMYEDQFREVLLNPGTDALHDQVAKPFDQEKFNELFRVISRHVADMPGSERAPYEYILSRIRHQFGEMAIERRKERNTDLRFLTNGGFEVGGNDND